MIFRGILTALITPFKDNKLDLIALERLMQRQIDANIDGIVIAGTTGEGTALTDSEYYELVRAAIAYANKRIPIIATITSASTSLAVEKVKKLSSVVGLAGIMVTGPHYIIPGQEGLFLHFKAINDTSGLPIMVYIHPGRTACNFSDDTILKLSKLDKVAAIKDASSDISRPLRLLPKIDYAFNFLTGQDLDFLAYSANGGSGCVSVMSNIAPKVCMQLNQFWQNEEVRKALKLQQQIAPFVLGLFVESNPICVKYAVHKMQLCSDEIRLPLTYANESSAKNIKSLLDSIIELEKSV